MQAQVRRINELKTRLTDSERRERQQQLQRTMTLLVHASACDNPNCPSTNCNKVKQLFKHAVACQQKVQGGCHLCRWACVLLAFCLALLTCSVCTDLMTYMDHKVLVRKSSPAAPQELNAAERTLHVM